MHLRVWLAERLAAASGAENLAGAPWLVYYARALGAQIGKGVDLHSVPPVTGLLTVGHRSAIEPEVDLCGHWIDGDVFHLGTITIGNDATIGARTTLLPGAVVGKNADVAPGSGVIDKIKNGQYWKGSPAAKSGRVKHPWPDERPARRAHWVAVYGLTSLLLAGLPLLAVASGLVVIGLAVHDTRSLSQALLPALLWTPPAALAGIAAYALMTVVGVRLLSIGLRQGYHPVRSRAGWQLWTTERLMDAARNYLFPLYASLLTPIWLRVLGTRVGRGTEISTVLLTPKFAVIEDGAFLADDTMVASYELGGGWIYVAETTVGRRAFLGNSGITQPGRRVPDDGLVAVLSATPPKAKRGSSWLGSPPMRLRRRPAEADEETTYDPPTRLKVMRAAVETCRLLPVMVTVAIGLAVLGALQTLTISFGIFWAALCGGLVLLAAGAIAGVVTVAAKWLLVGRIKAGEHPLWSPFVWRNELADTFVETVAAPWFARAASGTPVLNLWLRGLGASIGRGSWCETYWLPEADLVTLGAGSTVSRGCVVQTHLFHDRIMRMDSVVLEAGATLGPHCVALPAARLGAGASVGPASLVVRGDEVPGSTRWQGNPVRPWKPPGSQPARSRAARTRPPPVPRTPRREIPGKESPQERGQERRRRSLPTAERKLRLHGVAVRTRPRVQGRDQPAVGNSDDHRRHTDPIAGVHPRFVEHAVGVEGVGERQAPRAIHLPQWQVAHHVGLEVGDRCRDVGRRALRRDTRNHFKHSGAMSVSRS